MATNEEMKTLLNQWEKAAVEYLKLEKIIQGGPQLSNNLPLAAGVHLFLDTIKGQSKETTRTYRVGCRRFMWFIYTTTGQTPDRLAVVDLSPLVLEDYYLWLVDTYGRKSRSTCSAYMAAARNLFEYLARRRITPDGCQYQEMIGGLKRLQGRASYKTPRVKSEQVAQIAHQAVQKTDTIRQPKSQPEKDRRNLEELRDRAIILTLYCTGMRRQELASLNRPDLETLLADYHAQPQPLVEQTTFELIITGKGEKERLVYFDRLTLDAVEEYLNRRGKDGFRPLFLQHHRGRDRVKFTLGGENYRVSLVTVWQAVIRYASRLGLELKPHDFRHNLATTLLNNGAQLSEVQDILGHANPTTTKQIYAHYDKSHLREAFSKYRKPVDQL